MENLKDSVIATEKQKALVIPKLQRSSHANE